jgi:hypothetical protein
MRIDFFPLLCLVVVGSEICDPRFGKTVSDPEHCVVHSLVPFFWEKKGDHYSNFQGFGSGSALI